MSNENKKQNAGGGQPKKGQAKKGQPKNGQPNGQKKTADRKGGSKKGLIIALVVLLVVAGCAGGYMIWQNNSTAGTLSRDTYYDGVSVAGVDLSGKTREEARTLVAEQEQKIQNETKLALVYESSRYELTGADFAFTFDTDQVLETAYQAGRTGTDEERLAAIEALKVTPQNFDISYTVDASGAGARIAEIAAALDVEPVEPTIGEFNPSLEEKFVFTEGKDGAKVDQEALLAEVESKVAAKDFTDLVITLNPVSPLHTKEDLTANVRKIATASTTVTNNSNRNTNIRLITEKISGNVVMPGETFSVNETSGPRSAANGYKPAHALVQGEYVDEIGGGICQASTTLFCAVAKADLEIVERQPHGIPATYVEYGFDATVAWPSLDFKFKNNTEYPIYIEGYLDGLTLTYNIYGAPIEGDPGISIKLKSVYLGSIAQPEAKVTIDNSLNPGEEVVDKKGRTGHVADTYKVFYKDGKELKSEKLCNSRYPAAQAVIRKGPDATPSPSVTPSPNTPPPVTDPPVTQPPVTNPPASDPPATNPPAEGAGEGGA
ncbi:VanW family protein [Gehongia tenuis]|uniref:VanW family protein n=1 Tax=Gehongia tenuis TaxID=2763655 RepID=A0A926D281_9FIRM|nr:VanW family protein [Gehongia tenuis]MBC8530408.1 VanW family protein [Gehongia tenuis]